MLTAPASGLATPNFGTPLLSPHLAFPRSMPAILSPHLLPSPLAPTAPLLSPHFGFDASGAVTPVPAQTAGSVFTFASPSVLSAPVSPTQLQAVRRQPPPRVFVPCPPDEKAGSIPYQFESGAFCSRVSCSSCREALQKYGLKLVTW
eukprot:m.409216 g.409216  ORF g.409216 m.409216 type:complete len:147 (-) comp56510_c0_seq90:916-1356(-)